MDIILQQTVLTAQRYCHSKSDIGALSQLESKLDALIKAIQDSCKDKNTNNSFFAKWDTYDLLLSECINYCINCITSPHCPIELGFKIITLLNVLVWNNLEMRKIFQEQFQLSSVVSVYLSNCVHLDVKTILVSQCLILLQTVTYGTRVDNTSAMVDLLSYCCSEVLKPESIQGAHCLGILANLCGRYEYARDIVRRMIIANYDAESNCLFIAFIVAEMFTKNFEPFQKLAQLSPKFAVEAGIVTDSKYAAFRFYSANFFSVVDGDLYRKENVRSLYKQLMDNLQHKSVEIVIPSLLLLSCLDDILRQRVLNERNIHQTFQCVFNVLTKGDNFLARHYAVDLFTYILNFSLIQDTLSRHRHLDASLRQVVSLLAVIEPSPDLLKVYDLLIRFCQSDALREPVCRAVLDCPPVNPSQDSSLRTPLIILVQHVGAPMDLLPQLPLRALTLLTFLVQSIIGSGQRVQDYVFPEDMVRLLDECLKTTIETGHRHVEYKCEKILRALQLISELVQDQDMRADVVDVLTPALCAHLVEFQLLSNPIAFQKTNSVLSRDWSAVGVDVLLGLLGALKKLSQYSKTHTEQLHKLLKDQRLLPFLAYAVTAGDSARIHATLQIIVQNSSLQTPFISWLSELIAENLTTLRNARLPSTILQQPYQLNGDGPQHVVPSFTRQQPGEEARSADIDEIIKRFKTDINVQDPSLWKLMEVYDKKFSTLQLREHQLQELMREKTAALVRAENLVAQYRNQGSAGDSEAARLRSMLRESEQKYEYANVRVSDMRRDHDNLREEMSTLKMQLTQKDKDIESVRERESEFENRLAKMKETLASTRQEVEREKDLHTVLRKHYDKMKINFDEASSKLLEAEEDKKSLRKQLKEKEQALKAQTDEKEKLEHVLGNREEDLSSLEKNVEQLQRNLQALESEKRKLQKQLTECEHEVSRKSAANRELEAALNKLRSENENYSVIYKTIQQLTSDKQKQADLLKEHST